MEILAEGLVFDRVPADPDAQTQPPIAEDVNCSSLLGDESRLTLR